MVNTVYWLVNAITSEIVDSASPNLVGGFFMGRSRISSYLSHLDLLSRLLPNVNTMYQLVDAITCYLIDSASPNSIIGLFMGRSRMSSYLAHLDLLSRSLR